MKYKNETIIENGQEYQVITYENGDKEYYQNDKLHRTDAPAFECANGNKAWYQNGKFHRLDGPAVKWSNGDKSYWIDGVMYTYEEWKREVQKRNLI